MNKTEARHLLSDFILVLQKKQYNELTRLIGNPTCVEIEGISGTMYQIEYEAVWDLKPEGTVRIIASIDDGGVFSSLLPITLGFVMNSAGTVLA